MCYITWTKTLGIVFIFWDSAEAALAEEQTEVNRWWSFAYASIFMSLWSVMVTFLLVRLFSECRRYNERHVHRSSLKAYLQYRLGLWFSWTDGSSTIALIVLSLILLALGGLCHSFLASAPLADSLWASWVWIVAPDGGNSAQPGGYVVGMTVSLGGMLIFAMLVSIVTSAFEEQLSQLRQGAVPVVEGNHVVILGWKPAALDIVDEICMAAEGRGGEVIVLLTPLPKPDVEGMFLHGKVNLRNSMVVVRNGISHSKEDLEHVAVSAARVVLVLSQVESSREEADSRTLRVLLALCTQGWPRSPDAHIVAECCLVRNQCLFQSLAARRIEVLALEDFVGELMVEASRFPGLSSIINPVFSFSGDEFYLTHIDGISGCVFGDLLFAFPQVLIVGLDSPGHDHVVLAPPMDYILQGDERLVVIAEDATTLPGLLPNGSGELAISARAEATSRIEHRARKVQHRERERELVLILGWNEAVGSVILALDHLVASGSKVVIYSPRPASDREEWLEAAQTRMRYQFRKLDVRHKTGSLGARYKLDELPVHQASRIFILAESTAASVDDADRQTIAAILQVRDILWERNERKEGQVIMPQILSKNTELAVKACGLTDYIDSTKLAARVMASVCETPDLSAVFEQILAETGAKFSIRRLQDFAVCPAPEDGVSFNEVLAAASAAGEIAFGWTKDVEECVWEINPKDKQARRRWLDNSLIATLTPAVERIESRSSSKPTLRSSNFSRSQSFLKSRSTSFYEGQSSPATPSSPSSLHEPVRRVAISTRRKLSSDSNLSALSSIS